MTLFLASTIVVHHLDYFLPVDRIFHETTKQTLGYYLH